MISEDIDKAVKGVDFVYTDVWVSMGEPKEKWARTDQAFDPLSGQYGNAGQDRKPARAVHALPACVP